MVSHEEKDRKGQIANEWIIHFRLSIHSRKQYRQFEIISRLLECVTIAKVMTYFTSILLHQYKTPETTVPLPIFPQRRSRQARNCESFVFVAPATGLVARLSISRCQILFPREEEEKKR